jgi:hypothetical protein
VLLVICEEPTLFAGRVILVKVLADPLKVLLPLKVSLPEKVLLPLLNGTVAPEVPVGGTVIVGLEVTSINLAGELTEPGGGRLSIWLLFISRLACIELGT